MKCDRMSVEGKQRNPENLVECQIDAPEKVNSANLKERATKVSKAVK